MSEQSRISEVIISHLTAEDIAPILSSILGQICEQNNTKCDEISAFSRFTALVLPNISVEDYIQRICTYSGCSAETMVLSLIYIDKLITRYSEAGFMVTSWNIHRLLVTSVLISAKYFDDHYFDNNHYARMGGVSLQELNQLEVEFLILINFDLHVDVDTYAQYAQELDLHGRRMEGGECLYITPISSPAMSCRTSKPSSPFRFGYGDEAWEEEEEEEEEDMDMSTEMGGEAQEITASVSFSQTQQQQQQKQHQQQQQQQQQQQNNYGYASERTGYAAAMAADSYEHETSSSSDDRRFQSSCDSGMMEVDSGSRWNAGNIEERNSAFHAYRTTALYDQTNASSCSSPGNTTQDTSAMCIEREGKGGQDERVHGEGSGGYVCEYQDTYFHPSSYPPYHSSSDVLEKVMVPGNKSCSDPHTYWSETRAGTGTGTGSGGRGEQRSAAQRRPNYPMASMQTSS